MIGGRMAKETDIRNVENMITNLYRLLEAIKLGHVSVVASYTAELGESHRGISSVTHHLMYESLVGEGVRDD